MEESVVAKRPREESQVKNKDLEDCEESYSKRHKPYCNLILSLLESEELEDSTQDLSPLMTTLQQEITSTSHDLEDTLLSPSHNNNNNNNNNSQAQDKEDSWTTFSTNCNKYILKEDDKERVVMRYLLEASDDELGIPSSGDMFSSTTMLEDGYGLWKQHEDESLIY